MNYEIHRAFPTAIGIAKLDQEFCEPLKPLKGIGQYEDLNEQKDYFNILDRLPDLKKKFIKLFTDYINSSILNTPNQEYTITSSWITENNTGRAMTRHNHFNSYYSSVFYFDKVLKEHPPLSFERPEIARGFWVPPIYKSENESFGFVSNALSFRIEEGLIYFFPSHIYHSHEAFEPTEVPRKSLACNYIPINKFGRDDSTLDTRRIHG